jgi:hypothetical protein
MFRDLHLLPDGHAAQIFAMTEEIRTGRWNNTPGTTKLMPLSFTTRKRLLGLNSVCLLKTPAMELASLADPASTARLGTNSDSRERSHSNRKLLQNRIGGYSGRIILLTCDEIAVDEGMWRPRCLCDIARAGNAEAIF